MRDVALARDPPDDVERVRAVEVVEDPLRRPPSSARSITVLSPAIASPPSSPKIVSPPSIAAVPTPLAADPVPVSTPLDPTMR